MPSLRPCAECGELTQARTIELDDSGNRKRVLPICTRCLGEEDVAADKGSPLREEEWFDRVDCPECGAARSLYLLANRPASSVLGARTFAFARCTSCGADMPYGPPP